jgi:BirA family biotin operon repressor/biotin-[acetyl-CoA-carboxylase] ligase
MQIGQKILRFDRVDSTNNYTANLLKEGKIEHGTVIMADSQSAGRGQRGANWTSNAGENLLFSMFVAPDNLSVENQVVLTHFASLGIVEVLRKIGISAEIKWPNDIYVNHKKIAGILIENSIKGGLIANSIIGIGLNVNQDHFEHIVATSIKQETNNFHSIDSVVFKLIDELTILWYHIQCNDFQELKTRYLESLYLKGVKATFEDVTGKFEGIIEGVSEKSYLQIRKAGDLKEYDLKEISFLLENC